MTKAEQGDVLRIDGISQPVIVVSQNNFNKSGSVVVCPIVEKATESPLHISLKTSSVSGTVLCEQVRYLILARRRFVKLSTTHLFEIMDISDAVMGIFDYQKN